MLTSNFNHLPKDAKDHPAYAAFVEAMHNKAYGAGPLQQAWAWFKHGWDACLEASRKDVGG